MDRTDPRLAWLAAAGARWRRANEKTLVFVAHRETLEMLREALSARAQLASGVFHEDAVDGTARHRGRAVPRRRRAEPARLDRSRRRGTQLRVLPSAGALRPAVEARRRWSSASGGSIASAAACRSTSSISVRRPASAPTSSGCSSGSGCSASRWPASSRSSRTSSARSRRSRSIRTRRCPMRTIDQLDRRRTGRAHAHPRRGVPAAASRAVSRRARACDSRPRPGGPRRAHGARRRQRRLAPRLPRRAGARPTRLRDRVRQRGARRQPARRPGRHRRSSARSIASTRSRTRRSTSSRRGTRSSRDCWRTSRRIRRAASPGSTLRIPGQRGAGLDRRSTRTAPSSTSSAFDMDGQARPAWADAFRRVRSWR